MGREGSFRRFQKVEKMENFLEFRKQKAISKVLTGTGGGDAVHTDTLCTFIPALGMLRQASFLPGQPGANWIISKSPLNNSMSKKNC